MSDSIFFEQVGHQNTYASIGHKIFFTKWCHCQIYQNYEPVIFQHQKSTEFFLRRILHRKIIGQKSPNVLYECSPPFSCNNTLTLFQTSLAFHITRRHHHLVKTTIESHPSTYLAYVAMKFTCDFSKMQWSFYGKYTSTNCRVIRSRIEVQKIYGLNVSFITEALNRIIELWVSCLKRPFTGQWSQFALKIASRFIRFIKFDKFRLHLACIYSCNNITTALIQIFRIFYFSFFSKTNHQMMV